VPEHDGDDTSWAWLYLCAMVAAFVAYLAGLYLLDRVGGCLRRGAVIALACMIQLLPLGGPVLLSTDVYTYWDYARISTEHGGNPYVDEPADYPDDVAYPLMGSRWHETTSVYGPGFTLASELHASVVRESADAAAWLYRGLAAAAMVALVLLAARLSDRPAFAAAFVGWNPLLAVHFAGGGHNDAWMMVFVLAALALAATGRSVLAGVSWALAITIKWVPLLFLPLRFLEARRVGRQVDHWGLAAGLGVIVAIATIRYGLSWFGAAGPLASNLVDDRAKFAIPSRLASLGLPEGAVALAFAVAFVVAYAWLLREAWRGRARLALTAGLLLVCTSWLVPWYAVWAVPLAAVEEDRTAQVLALALSAYLLRVAVPI
jgi:alpha-1,6-mannosyltransferase